MLFHNQNSYCEKNWQSGNLSKQYIHLPLTLYLVNADLVLLARHAQQTFELSSFNVYSIFDSLSSLLSQQCVSILIPRMQNFIKKFSRTAVFAFQSFRKYHNCLCDCRAYCFDPTQSSLKWTLSSCGVVGLYIASRILFLSHAMRVTFWWCHVVLMIK